MTKFSPLTDEEKDRMGVRLERLGAFLALSADEQEVLKSAGNYDINNLADSGIAVKTA